MTPATTYRPIDSPVEEHRTVDLGANDLLEYAPPMVIKLRKNNRSFHCTGSYISRFLASNSDNILEATDLVTSRLVALRKERRLEVLSLKLLEENWDGYGAIPSTTFVVNNVLSFIDQMNEFMSISITDIHPNPHGTITFEWSTGKGIVWIEFGESYFNAYRRLLNEDVQIFQKQAYDEDSWNRIEAILAKVL